MSDSRVEIDCIFKRNFTELGACPHEAAETAEAAEDTIEEDFL